MCLHVPTPTKSWTGSARLTSRAATPANSASVDEERLQEQEPAAHSERHSTSTLYARNMRSSRPLPFPIQNQTDAEFAQWYHRDPIFNEHDYSAQNKSIHAVLVQRGSLPNTPPPPPPPPRVAKTSPDARHRAPPNMALGWSWSRPGSVAEVQEASRCFGAPEKTRVGRPDHHGNPHRSADQPGLAKL